VHLRATFVVAAIAALFVSAGAAAARPLTGIHKIRHIVVIMQENRSFDSYFGTYPGADGIPKNVCVPNPMRGGCQRLLAAPDEQQDRALGREQRRCGTADATRGPGEDAGAIMQAEIHQRGILTGAGVT